jgi:hypothetical protein
MVNPEWMSDFTRCMTDAVNNSKEEWMRRGMRGPALYQQCQETCEATCKAYNGVVNAERLEKTAGWPKAFPVKGEYVGLLDEQYVRRWKADSVAIPGFTFMDGSVSGMSGEALDLPPSRTHVWIVLVEGDMPRDRFDEWYASKVHEVDPTVYQFKDQFSTVWSSAVIPGDLHVIWNETVNLWAAAPIRLGLH